MKTLACIVLTAGVLASPVVSFAQSTGPVTREQVRAELVRLEQAGPHDLSRGDPGSRSEGRCRGQPADGQQRRWRHEHQWHVGCR
jgi:hypothetical protein